MKSTAADYTHLLQQLLPPGAAWPRDPDAVLTRLLSGFADGLSRHHNRAIALIDEADPRSADEMLTDWERVAGLPTTCLAGIDQTVAERRLTLHAHITSRGGQSRAFYIALAAALGYEITITEFRPLTAGFTAGSPCCGEDWWFVWQVNAPETTIRPFKAGQSKAGEPVRTWGNERLECEITRRKPAHTHVLFAYGEA